MRPDLSDLQRSIMSMNDTTDPMNVIKIHPDFERLKNDLDKLRMELSMLVLEHDELLYQVCRNIETEYMLAVGGLEYKAYETECAVLRLKRKVEMIQAKKNRQEPVVLEKIEEILDLEFSEFQERLEEQIRKMNAALERSHGRVLNDEETRELKSLYRSILKVLHPDLFPDLSFDKKQLFQNAVDAYEMGDLQGLRIIAAMVAEPVLDLVRPDAVKLLVKERERLMGLLAEQRERIANIKASYPYTMKTLVENPVRVEERKAEIEERIGELKDVLVFYEARIGELLR